MVDVYQGCHAAIFLVDPSKKWTYEYVQRELALVGRCQLTLSNPVETA
jgi:hypothetical protein